MNAVLQVDGGRLPESCDPKGRHDKNPYESRESLRRAVRTLRAIRLRYEMGHNAYPDVRCYSVQIAVDSGDISWITAAIDTLETSLAGATEIA
jgi:hypothetical protein